MAQPSSPFNSKAIPCLTYLRNCFVAHTNLCPFHLVYRIVRFHSYSHDMKRRWSQCSFVYSVCVFLFFFLPLLKVRNYVLYTFNCYVGRHYTIMWTVSTSIYISSSEPISIQIRWSWMMKKRTINDGTSNTMKVVNKWKKRRRNYLFIVEIKRSAELITIIRNLSLN